MEANPFLKENIDLTNLHLSFLKEEPSRALVQNLSFKSFEPDRFVIRDKEIFVCCEDKYHKSKLSNNFLEKKLQVQATTRNWKTITKLVELSNI
ncbi:MAG: DUF1697 domain-containing protein, partial [Gramella sp.]|nr:DUF1697 domain-containing protein [Christiangramia sp.]